MGAAVVLGACGSGGSSSSSKASSSTSSPRPTSTFTSGPTLTAAPVPTAAPTGVQVLTITPDERTALHDAHLASLRSSGARADGVDGPLPDTVYYALDRSTGTFWALATFSHPDTGTTDQPEIFSKQQGAPWQDLGDSGGNPCKVPAAVLAAWGYRASCRGSPILVPPTAGPR